MKHKERLDVLLVARNLAESRSKAQAMIMAGEVYVNEQKADKAGLEINIDPVALHIGHGIYWYGIIIACGFLLAVLFCSRCADRYGIEKDHLYDMLLIATPISIVGARAYYVIFYLDLFRNADGSIDWPSTIAIWDGGLAIYGGVIAAVLTVYFFCRWKKIKVGAMLDLGCMGLLIGQMIGRWGNFINREAFGAETTLPWRMRLWESADHFIEVHPTFFYESLWNLIGLLLIVLVVEKYSVLSFFVAV